MRRKVLVGMLVVIFIIATIPTIHASIIPSYSTKDLIIYIRGEGVKEYKSYTLEKIVTGLTSHRTYILDKEEVEKDKGEGLLEQLREEKIIATADFSETLFPSGDPKYVYVYIPSSIQIKLIKGENKLSDEFIEDGYNIYEFKLPAEPSPLWGNIGMQNQWTLNAEFKIEKIKDPDSAHHSLIMIADSKDKLKESSIESIIKKLTDIKGLAEKMSEIGKTESPFAYEISESIVNSVKDILSGYTCAEILIRKNLPDLVVEEVWWNPKKPEMNTDIEVYYQIKNIGEESADPTTTRIFFTRGDKYIVDDDIPKLEKNEYIKKGPHKTNLNPPNNDIVRKIYIEIDPDIENNVPEINDANTIVISYDDILNGQFYTRGLKEEEKSSQFKIPGFIGNVREYIGAIISTLNEMVITLKEKTISVPPEEKAKENVEEDLSALSSMVEAYSKWMKMIYELSEVEPPEGTEMEFRYQVTGAKFCKSVDEARAYMSSNGIESTDMNDALGLVKELELEKKGFCIVIVDYSFTGFGERESGRYPIVCNEKGDPFWESWQFYEKIKKEIEEAYKEYE